MDDWDDDTPSSSTEQFASNGDTAREGGRGFMNRGRGFSSNNNRQHENSFNGGHSKNDPDGWGEDSSPKHDGDTWNERQNEDRPRRGGRGGGRGRGGSRGGGGRGGRRNWNGDEGENNDGFDENNDTEDNNGNRFGGGRGRGGRGGGRGGRGGGGRGGEGRNDNNEENGEAFKANKEIYVPPEPTTDENEMFSTGISSGINFCKFDDIEVKISGENVPQPITSFKNSGLRQLLMDNVTKSGYTKPTPIQKHAIPIIMANRDLMACAQTGSGKTAAFLLPIINNLLSNPVDLVVDGLHSEPQAIIVSPTRELAIQIYEEARKFAYNSMIKVVIAYGGTAVGYQLKHVLSGCHILVATPGRLSDFVKRGSVTFSSVRYVVLDEADRMLDMGFLPGMEEMMSHETMVQTGERTTLMFSATFPEEIQRLAAKFLDNYIFVTVGIVGSASTDVEQSFYQVDKFKKRTELQNILKTEGTEGTLVFVETKRNADFLATFLSENDHKTTSIHGDRMQREREEALNDFKRGSSSILVATAVAARGLDIKNVRHVINYDLPKSIDEYVHRIGRTGRVGNRGKATSFYDVEQDSALAGDLARILKQAGQSVPDFLQNASSGGGGGSFRGNSFGGHDFRGSTAAIEPRNAEVIEEEW